MCLKKLPLGEAGLAQQLQQTKKDLLVHIGDRDSGNAVLFDLTGGAGSIAPTHRLNIKMTTSRSVVIVDINTGRTEDQITGIDVKYTMTELATGRVVLNATAFARTSSDIPGQQQRFANQRALRDAEERAANVIADQIRSRLSSYFVA